MDELTTIAKVIGFLAILIVGAALRDKTYKNARNWSDLYDKDRRAQLREERRLRKQQKKALRDFDKQKQNK